MYIREKRVPRGGKTYSYWQLVEGVRDGERVRQKVVKYLGAWPDREKAEIHARRLGVLCSALGCNRRANTGIRPDGRDNAKFCEEHDRQVRDGTRSWEEPVYYYPLY